MTCLVSDPETENDLKEANEENEEGGETTKSDEKPKTEKRDHTRAKERQDSMSDTPVRWDIRDQFCQHFTSSFYSHISQKHTTDDFTSFFALLGSTCVKAAHKMLMKLL